MFDVGDAAVDDVLPLRECHVRMCVQARGAGSGNVTVPATVAAWQKRSGKNAETTLSPSRTETISGYFQGRPRHSRDLFSPPGISPKLGNPNAPSNTYDKQRRGSLRVTLL